MDRKEDGDKTKEELLREIEELRGRVRALEVPDGKGRGDAGGLPASLGETPGDSEEHWRMFMKSVPQNILLINRDAVIEFTNNVMGGFRIEDIPGHSIFEFMPEEYREPVRRKVDRAFETGNVERYECEALYPDGRRVWYEAYIGPIEHDGDILTAALINIDITELKRVEEALRDALEEARVQQKATSALLGSVRSVLESTTFAEAARSIFRTCRELIGAEAGYAALLSEEGEECNVLLLGSGLDECRVDPSRSMAVTGLRGEVYRTAKARFDNAFAEAGAADGLPPGHVRLENVLFVPLNTDGRAVGVLGLANKPGGFSEADVRLASLFSEYVVLALYRSRAEEKQRELETQVQHAQKLESLGVLAGGIAHDFNNLLVGVLGNAGLALHDLPPGSPARFPLKQIEKTAQKMAQLAGQMLDYSGRGHLIVEPLDLSKVVGEMGQMMLLSISKKANIHFELAEDLPLMKGDVSQISQVIMNLLTNASEALGGESGTIVVSTGLTRAGVAGPGDVRPEEATAGIPNIFLQVEDTGCGMDEETREKIFDPFFTTKFTGRGLGMSATLGIVRGHDGLVEVESEPGKGTTIRLQFPVSEGGKPKKKRRERTTEEIRRDTAQLRFSGTVLVVDDEEWVRDVARRMLEKQGFLVMTAGNGREAVERFARHSEQICLVLLDYTMPQMNGEETYAELRKIDEATPVILASGYSERELAERYSDSGLKGFIQKPYLSATLIEKIRGILEGE